MTIRRSIRRVAGVMAAGALFVAATTARAEMLSGLKAADPQPSPDKLAPGLAVSYVFGMFNHIKEFKDKKSEVGAPLAHLDHRMGEGLVLTAKERDGVGAIITGFIRFEKPGTYGFDVTSNDGVRVEIGGKLLYEDPTVHADDTSDRIDVKIDRPGWYPIHVLYFEKKRRATLVLRWVPPGSDAKAKPVPVPAAAFARLK
jgi:PA14 domain-containing protein